MESILVIVKNVSIKDPSMGNIELRDKLATLYPTVDDAHRIVKDTNLDLAYISFDGKAVNMWQKILDEFNKRNAIGELYQAVEKEYPGSLTQRQGLNEKVKIPFLIVAMKRDQAAELFGEMVVKNQKITKDQKSAFQEFWEELNHQELRYNPTIHGAFIGSIRGRYQFWRKMFTKFGISLPLSKKITEGLQSHYAASPDIWRPLYCDHSVKQIIEEAFIYFNEQNEPIDIPNLIPDFVSERFFSINSTTRDDAIEQLETFRSVVVIDVISLFHPLVREQLNQANILGNKNIAILFISPVDATVLPVNQRIMKLLEKDFQRVFSRFYNKYDRLCEIDLDNIHSLKRWIVHAIPNIVTPQRSGQSGGPHPKKREGILSLATNSNGGSIR